MKRKFKNAFTLTELIVVIAIIGILAAVLIPSLTGYIQKAKLSNDKVDAKNMTTELNLYMIENNLDTVTAPEIRSILGSKYNYDARAKDYFYFYNKNEKKIEVSKLNTVSAATNGTKELEEVVPGKLLLDSEGSTLAKTIYQIRNLVVMKDFDDLYNKVTDANLKSHLESFNGNTLFISNTNMVTNINENSLLISNVIFADGTTIMPNAPFNDIISFSNDFTLKLPSTIRFVEADAFKNLNVSKVNNAVNVIFEQKDGQARPDGMPEPVKTEFEKLVTINYKLVTLENGKVTKETKFIPLINGKRIEKRSDQEIRYQVILNKDPRFVKATFSFGCGEIRINIFDYNDNLCIRLKTQFVINEIK